MVLLDSIDWIMSGYKFLKRAPDYSAARPG